LSSQLGGKIRKIESAIGGRRFTRERLTTTEGRFAHAIGEYLRTPGAVANIHPEQRAAMWSDIHRALLADVRLASGSAAGLAPAYRAELAEWTETIDGMLKDMIRFALAAEGFADWDSKAQAWAWPGEGDPRDEPEFVTERRIQLSLERAEAWMDSLDGWHEMFAKASIGAAMAEKKQLRRGVDPDSLATLAKLAELARIKARGEPDDSEN